MKMIIYFIGKHSKRFRIWYWYKTGGKWLWGYLRCIKDLFKE